jgi:hypothetical protein
MPSRGELAAGFARHRSRLSTGGHGSHPPLPAVDHGHAGPAWPAAAMTCGCRTSGYLSVPGRCRAGKDEGPYHPSGRLAQTAPNLLVITLLEVR